MRCALYLFSLTPKAHLVLALAPSVLSLEKRFGAREENAREEMIFGVARENALG